jgi:predicted permease
MILENLNRDLRHAWRMIVKMPALAAVVIVSLGVGIGVNTTVFSWIQLFVLQPLPGVPGSASLQLIEPRSEIGARPGVSWLEYRDLQERLHSFRDLLAFRMATLNVGEGSHIERTFAQLVSGNYFLDLGLQPALGRFIRPDEAAQPGGEPVVVISHEYWQTRFQGAGSALGQTIRVNERPLTIVGVAPQGFQGSVLGLNFDLWIPATLAPTILGGSRELEDRSMRGYTVTGMLQPGATQAQAQGEVDAAMRQLAQDFPDTNAKMQADVLPFWQNPRGPQRMFIRGLTILQGVMLLLLLAVCGNTANLLLARASVRQREMGVRMALGAGRWRIASLLLTENLVLSLLGAALGIAIAVWGTQALRAMPLTGALPIKFQTSVDAVGLAFAVLLGLACGLMSGVAPAIHLARVNPQIALRSGSRSGVRSRWRNALMGAEVALALVVLVFAGMFLRSFSETRETDPGFRREGVLLAAYDLSPRNPDGPTIRTFTSRLLEQLRAIPGVESAAISMLVPLDLHGVPPRAFTLEGRARTESGSDQALNYIVTPGYFKTMGIPLRAGTDFVELNDSSTPPQAIVNEEFVRRFVNHGEALGRRIESRGRNYQIAGVVRNSLYESFGERPTPMIYFSYRDRQSSLGEMHLRTRAGGEMLLASGVERAVHQIDPTLPVYDVRTLNDHIEKNLVLRRIPARMFVVLGPLLLMLAAIGIYAVVAYTVSQRTMEIGVRLAMGATSWRVVRQMVRECLWVIGRGALAGWGIAFVVQIHVAPGTPLPLSVYLGIPALLMLVATAACGLPTWRAARMDPMVALRTE